MTYVPNRNPRFNRHFSVIVRLEDYTLTGLALSPSAFGASVEISQFTYEYLREHSRLWENSRRINVSTALNDIPAAVNSLFDRDGKYFISLKLLDNRSWYQ